MRRATWFLLLAALPAWACGKGPQGPGSAASSSSSSSSGGSSGSTSGATYAPGQTSAATIGPSGGTLSAPNGRVDLVIPPGALAQDTQVTIQTVGVTEADGAQYTVYELGPDGLQFPSAPYPRLVLHYTQKDLENTAPELLGARFQNPDGTWSGIGDAEVDADAGTVSAPLPHFSKWRWKGTCQIYGGGPVVLSGNHLHMQMLCDVNVTIPGIGPQKFVVHDPEDPFFGRMLQHITVRVNGVENGNATVGTAQFDPNLSTGEEGDILAYQAPDSIPFPGTMPVTLEWDVEVYSPTQDPLFKKTLTVKTKAAQRDWLLRLKFHNDRACGPPANNDCSYRYLSQYDLPITIIPDGAHHYQVQADDARALSIPTFDQLTSCDASTIKCEAGPAGSTKGIEKLVISSFLFYDSIDQLRLLTEIEMQDIPTYKVTYTQTGQEQDHTYQGTTWTVPGIIGPLQDGTTVDNTFRGQDGATRGSTWELHWTPSATP